MNQTLRHVLFSLIVISLIGGGWYALRLEGQAGVSSFQDLLAAAQVANSAGLSPQAAAAATEAAAAPFQNTYKNEAYGFSFKYPSSLKIGAYTPQGGSATTILAQNVSEHIGFQIYITPFNKPDTVITLARITRDIPNLIIREAQVAQIGPSSPGVAFLTEDPSFGESRQVWFVYKKHLYQISTYSSQDALLEKVLATWVFRVTGT